MIYIDVKAVIPVTTLKSQSCPELLIMFKPIKIVLGNQDTDQKLNHHSEGIFPC